MDAIVHNQNSNAVRMKLLLPKDQTSKDALVLLVNTVAAQMETLRLKDPTLMDVKIFQRHRKNLAVFQKMAAPVAISPLKTSSMSNMEHAPDSGTAAAVVTIIDLKQSKNAKVPASKLKEKVLVCCRKFMVPAPDTIRRSTMTLIEICVHNSFMAVVWVTIIDSKQLNLARNYALLIKLYVRICR